MNTLVLLLVYCGVIMACSLLGGRLSALLRMTHLRTQLLMSGVGGLMLGIAMLHLLPHAAEALDSPSRTGAGALAGLTFMFLLIRLFHTHDHAPTHDHGAPAVDADRPSGQEACDHGASGTDCDHANARRVDGSHQPHPDPVRGLSWAGLFLGLLLHTLVDGIALAASVVAETDHGVWLGLGGLGTFLAVALHKPLDAFAITSVMSRQNWSSRAQRLANGVFSLACPIGAIGFYFGVSGWFTSPDMLGWGLAISAGFFIGIALADLLPEVAFHDHDRGKLTFAFLMGIAIAVGVENLPGHDHANQSQRVSDHSEVHHGHSHGLHDPHH